MGNNKNGATAVTNVTNVTTAKNVTAVANTEW